MPLQIMLPNGTPTLLESLSDHDLRQYYMHQMDMLTQAEDVLERLGISGWLNGTQNPSEKGVVVERYSSPASEFMAPPSAGNHLPTHYDAARWNGLVNDSGRRATARGHHPPARLARKFPASYRGHGQFCQEHR